MRIKINRTKLFLSFLMIMSFRAFSFDGVMAGQKDLKIARTEHFDIIYAPGSLCSADIIYKNADKIYDELAEKFSLLHDFRLPVVISPSQDSFNAYYSSAPFNHIVIYDTVPHDSQVFFADTLLNTFRHELIHAVTYNMHNSFWSAVKSVLGDTYNPALATVTTALAEGAAVSVESDGGEGRLNSGFHRMLVRQAKIEGRFPKYSEIQGGRDIKPGTNMSYYFGGAFSEYLQKKYGMEKYAEFWYRCVNFQTSAYFICFKKVYGIPVREAWQDFYDSVDVSSVRSSSAAFSETRFTSARRSEMRSEEKLSACPSGLYFFDGGSSSVKYASSSAGFSTARTLFRRKNVSRLSVSSDGKYAAVSYLSLSSRVPENKVHIYSTDSRRFYSFTHGGVRDACVFYAEEKYYAALVSTSSQFCRLDVYELELRKDGSVRNASFVTGRKFGFSQAVYSPSADSCGRLYYILKDGSERTVNCVDIFTEKTVSFRLPLDGMEIRSLSVFEDGNVQAEESAAVRLAFSCTIEKSMPRLAYLDIDFRSYSETAFFLGTEDYSGGIFSPVFIDSNTFVFESHFFDESRIRFGDSGGIPVRKFSVDFRKDVLWQADNADFCRTFVLDGVGKSSVPFSLFKYSLSGPHGTVVPAALTGSYSIKDTADGLDSVMIPLGLTYITSSPWTYPVWGFSAGYSPLTNSGAFMAAVYGGTSETQLLKYTAAAQFEVDSEGYKQSYATVTISSKKELGRLFYLGFSEEFAVFEGRQTLTELPDYAQTVFAALKNYDGTHRFLQTSRTSLGLGNIAKSGAGFYDYSGFEVSTFYNESFCSRVSSPAGKYREAHNIGLAFTAKSDFLLPTTFETALFPSENCFLACAAKFVLFSSEIQKSTDRLPLFYMNRFTLDAYYLAKFADNRNFRYSDQAALNASFSVTPNIGGLANPLFRFELGASFLFRPCPEQDQGQYSVAVCGITVF